MDNTIQAGDTVAHHLGGPSGKVTEIFRTSDGVAYAFVEGQLGALPLKDAVKIAEDDGWRD